MREASGEDSEKKNHKKNTDSMEGKNNPRATVVERVDTTEPQFKRRTTELVV